MAMKRVVKWIRVYTYPRSFLRQFKLNEEGIPFKTRFCYCTYSLSRINSRVYSYFAEMRVWSDITWATIWVQVFGNMLFQ